MACLGQKGPSTFKKEKGYSSILNSEPLLTRIFDRFLNGDYVLSGALEGCENIQRICLSYDVVCSYLVNIHKRFSEFFPDQLPLLEKILFLIPKAHLVGHKELCQILYSFNYTPEVGRTHGEVVEQGWAKGNENMASTRQMNPDHRHDTLNDQHSAMNLDKVIGLGECSSKIFGI